VLGNQARLCGSTNNLGTVLVNCGRLDEAIAEYRKALAMPAKYAAARAKPRRRIEPQERAAVVPLWYRRRLAAMSKATAPASKAMHDGSGTATTPAAGAPRRLLVVIRQHEAQVVDVHSAIASDIAGGPTHPDRLVVIRQHECFRSLMSTRPSELTSPGHVVESRSLIRSRPAATAPLPSRTPLRAW